MVFNEDYILKQVISRMCIYPMLKTLCSLVFYLPGGFTSSLNVVCTLQLPSQEIHFLTVGARALSAASTRPFTSLSGRKIQAGGTRVGVSQVKHGCNSLMFQEGNISGTTRRATAVS